MHLDFKGKTALVTGAAQGIGAAIAKALKAAGADIVVCDLDKDGLAAIAQDLDADQFSGDLSDQKFCRELIEQIVQKHNRIDVLIHAAGGVCGQIGQDIEQISPEQWNVIFEANVNSAFWLCQAAAPVMKKQSYGRIVTITSGAGLRPSLTGIQAYTSAKHALVGLTKQLSHELAPHGITTNSVAPGFVLSNPTTEKQWQAYGPEKQASMIEGIHTRRLGKAEDIANAALFFASDQAEWITGQILSVDGGRS